MSKFTEQQKSDMYFIMGTAKMECEMQLGLEPSEVEIYQQKTEGVYYLVGSERNEKGIPTKIHFKKDFR
tara:strand:+ start:129 stop:335 length:207 start_codon:yes stop_codon:yes gene_type:complete